MSHVLTIRSDAETVPYHADPILAAIDRHAEAWSVFQVAPEGQASVDADAEAFDALHALLATPCATRAGMFCLIRHLRWWLAEEAVNAGAYNTDDGLDAWGVAQAREADLSRCLGVERIERLPIALPSGRLLGPVIDLRPVAAATPVRFARLLSRAGDVVAALALVIGGCGLTSLASLL
ncbi:hypothetical protein [Methylorubrum extorquens]|uniref:Uncharacterized protein n=1 Tax=Methylorubrum extorquens (strain CM4 / NCIMB 13688) TaxID=440085 RepID=B7L3Q6_METC4|nr:hypothetical protein [Methylorubrum extorquens]ACK86464.1 hypothetical protein Mchl_5752 [Methylorubrum extorquens CM4]